MCVGGAGSSPSVHTILRTVTRLSPCIFNQVSLRCCSEKRKPTHLHTGLWKRLWLAAANDQRPGRLHTSLGAHRTASGLGCCPAAVVLKGHRALSPCSSVPQLRGGASLTSSDVAGSPPGLRNPPWGLELSELPRAHTRGPGGILSAEGVVVWLWPKCEDIPGWGSSSDCVNSKELSLVVPTPRK